MYNPTNRPPVGGTDWAAGHILRLLKEQAAARAAGERASEAGGEAPGPLDWLVDPAAAAHPAVPHPAALARMRLAQGAPSAAWGIDRTGTGPANMTPSEMVDTTVLLASLLPVAGDAIGLANDIRHYATEPESRTLGNYALSVLGLLPLVPSVSSMARFAKPALGQGLPSLAHDARQVFGGLAETAARGPVGARQFPAMPATASLAPSAPAEYGRRLGVPPWPPEIDPEQNMARWLNLLLLGGATGMAAEQMSRRWQDHERALADPLSMDALPPEKPAPPGDFEPVDVGTGTFVNIPPVFPRRPARPGDRDPVDAGGGTFVNVPPKQIPSRPPPFPAESPVKPKPMIFQIHEFNIWDYIYFNSRGDDRTQKLNSDIAGAVVNLGDETGQELVHTHGATNTDKSRLKEYYLENRDTKGRDGSNRTDITIQDKGSGRLLHIQTVTTKANGRVPSIGEHGANIRVLKNKETDDLLVLIPKLPKGAILDVEALKQRLRPIVEELGRPASKGPGAEGIAPEPWWLFDPVGKLPPP